MRKVAGFFVASIVVAVVLSACGMGLEPAKSDTTRVSFTFAVSSTMDSAGVSRSSRAIIPDGGYLYVRMIGGPTAPNAEYLGPFQVTGRSPTVSIDKIPAGSYDYMFLLYTERPIHNEKISIEGPDGTSSEITMGDFLSLPDELFLEIMEDDDDDYEYEYEYEYPLRNTGLLRNEIPSYDDWDDGPDEIELLFAGRASTGAIENPVIVEGNNNTFSVTMIPITPYWISMYWVSLDEPLYLEELIDSYESFKGFIEIYDLDYLYSHHDVDRAASLTLTFSNAHGTESMTVNHLSIYDGDGKLIGSGLPGTIQLAPDQSHSYTVSVPAYDEIFFYLDVSGGSPALTISLDGVEPEDPNEEEPIKEEPIEEEPELPDMVPITGSLSLSDYAYNFDTVDSVMFCTQDPKEWFSDELTWANIDLIVGSAKLVQSTEQNEEAIYSFYEGAIYTGYDNVSVYMLIVGSKHGMPVYYTTNGILITLTDGYYVPDMTPLLQYVVVYAQSGGQGLAEHIDKPANLKLTDNSEPVQNTIELSSFVQIVDEGVLEGFYVAIFPLVEEDGSRIVLNKEGTYDVVFDVSESPEDGDLYNNEGEISNTELYNAFITIVFDMS